MKNPTGNKLEKLVFKIFDQMVEGADKYVTKQGSTWLIFTESRKWVIEFTKDKTLWFNYNVFQNELDLIGKDCTEERDLIKNWFESRFLNKPKVKESHHVDVMKFLDKKMENTIQNGVKNTIFGVEEDETAVEDAIQEGVKRTFDMEFRNQLSVEDTIQEGVKHTDTIQRHRSIPVKDTIQNGVKYTWVHSDGNEISVEDTIQNGVKETRTFNSPPIKSIEDTIENGVKHTIDEKSTLRYVVEDTIQNGVKETQTRMWPPVGAVDDTIQNGVKETHHVDVMKFFDKKMEDALQNGVKETKTPGKDGDLLGFLDFMSDNNTDSVPQLIDDVIENGVTEDVTEDGIVGVKKIISDDGYMNHFKQDYRAKQTIEKGVKETKEMDHDRTTYHAHFNRENGVHTPLDKVQDVINSGIKELKVWKSNRCIKHGYFELVNGYPTYTPMTEVNDVIDNGVKEVYEDPYHHKSRIDGVLKKGDKL